MGMNQIALIISILLAFSFGFESLAQVPDIPGCTNPEACNFNPDANIEDGSCEFEEHPLIPNQDVTFGGPVLYWCGPLPDCSNITFGCGIPGGYTPADPDCFEAVLAMLPTCHEAWTSTCWVVYAECMLGIPGCTDPYACNYVDSATFDIGDCLYPGYPCVSEDPCVDGALLNLDCQCVGEGGDADGDGICSGEDCDDDHPGLPLPDGSCSDMIAGCMDEGAANYRDNATFPTACITAGPCGTIQWAPGWSFGLIDWLHSPLWDISDPDDVWIDGVSMTITGPDEGVPDTAWASVTVPAELQIEFTFAFHTTDVAPIYDYPFLQVNGQTTGLMDYLIDTPPPGLPLDDASTWAHGQPVMPPAGWIPDPDLLPSDNTLSFPLLVDGAESWDYPYQAPISLQLNAGDVVTIGVVSSDGLFGEGSVVVTAFAHELYCPGCTDSLACNFDTLATHDDETCDYSCIGCMDEAACNFSPEATQPDSCIYSCFGCIDPLACNYSAEATFDDGSCDFCSCANPPGIAATPAVPLNTTERGMTLLTSGGNLFDCPVLSLELEALEGEFGPVIAMDGGGEHVLTLRADSILYGLGQNQAGQLAIPADLGLVTAFSAGGQHSLAIDGDGVLHGWGDNTHGQLELDDMADVVGVEAGNNHTLSWKSSGSIVLAVGDNSVGQCDVPPALNVLKVAASNHNVALTTDSTVVCWGSNAFGQCNVPEFDQPVVDVGASLHTSMALLKDGTLVVWGRLSLLQEPEGVFSIEGNPSDDFLALLDMDGTAIYVSDDGYIAYQAPVPGLHAHSRARCTEWCLDRDEDGLCDAADPCIGVEDEECGCECLNDANGNGLCDETEIRGCTDFRAGDFNPRATFDTGCESFATAGCQSPIACNYNPEATHPGICDFESCGGCTDEFACNYDPAAKWDIGSCEFTSCAGCPDPLACNYNPKVPGGEECDYCSCHFAEPSLETYYSQHLVINSLGEATFGGSNFINSGSFDQAINASRLSGTTWTNVGEGAVSPSGALLLLRDSSLQLSSPSSLDYYLDEVRTLEAELESELAGVDLHLSLISGVIEPPAGNDFVDVAMGFASFMALRLDGTVEVWGSLPAAIVQFSGNTENIVYADEPLNLEDWAESLQGVVDIECSHLWDFHAILDDGTWESYTSDAFNLALEIDAGIVDLKCDFIQCMCRDENGQVYNVNATSGALFNGWPRGLPPLIAEYGAIVDYDCDFLSTVLFEDGSVGVWLLPNGNQDPLHATILPPEEVGTVERVYGGMQLYLQGSDGVIRSYDMLDIFPDAEGILSGEDEELSDIVTFSFPDSVLVSPPTECGQDCPDSDGDGICDGADDCDGVKDALGQCGGDCLLDANNDGICDVLNKPGCTYPESCSFLPDATWDDGSCVFNFAGANDFSDWFNPCPADIDANGTVQTQDLLILLGNFGFTCEGGDGAFPDPCAHECGTELDYHGYAYATLDIGGHCWFQENLRTNYYTSGESIAMGLDTDWPTLQSGAYVMANGDSAGFEIYGLLYNGYAVQDDAGLCPIGWHVPTDEDWMAAEIHIGLDLDEVAETGSRGEAINIGSRFKANSMLWTSPGTNSSGFTALPAGRRMANGDLQGVNNSAWFWSSSLDPEGGQWCRALFSFDPGINRVSPSPAEGYSIRCVKDL